MLNVMLRPFACVLLLGAAMVLGINRAAEANSTFANQTGATCDTCHQAGIDPNKDTLNTTGSRYLTCHYNAACAGIQTGTARSAAVAKPQLTSKDYSGLETFTNRCSNQELWLMFHTPNAGTDFFAVKLGVGQKVQTVIQKGTMYAYSCGNPGRNAKFVYVPLEAASSEFD